MPWLREIAYIEGWDGYWYSPLWINPADAEARGIKDGDIVRFFNNRGGVLAVAFVTDRIIAGALKMDKGGGGDMIIVNQLNRDGDPNSINVTVPQSRHAYGNAPSNYLVQVEKVTGEMMDEWRNNYPDAFERDYDPAYGPLFSGWVIKEGEGES